MSPTRRPPRRGGPRAPFTEPPAELVDFTLYDGRPLDEWKRARIEWWREHKLERPAPLRGLWGMLADNLRASGAEIPEGLLGLEDASSERSREQGGNLVAEKIREAIIDFRERHSGDPLPAELQKWADRLGI